MKNNIIDNVNYEIIDGVWVDNDNIWCHHITDGNIIISYANYLYMDGEIINLKNEKYISIFNNRLKFYRPDENAYYLVKWNDNYYVKELNKSILGITLWLVRKDKKYAKEKRNY